MSATNTFLHFHTKDTVIFALKLDTLLGILDTFPWGGLRAELGLSFFGNWTRDSLQLQSEEVEIDRTVGEPNIVLAVVASRSGFGGVPIGPGNVVQLVIPRLDETCTYG